MTNPPRQPLRIAITGASGFIGSRLLTLLRTDGYSVRTLVQKTTGHAIDVGIIGDLASPNIQSAVRHALRDIDVVVHLAGMAHVPLFNKQTPMSNSTQSDQDSETRAWKINVDGTRHVRDAALAAGVQHLLYLS